MAAQRARWSPWRVMWQRWTFVSDSRWLGVMPAQEQRWRAGAQRVASPISATKTAAKIGPTPSIAWMAS